MRDGAAKADRIRLIGVAAASTHPSLRLALAAGVGLLALTHLSNRYFGPELAAEAQEIFAATLVPRDFDTIEVPFPERGAPVLHERGARRPRHAVASAS